MVKLLIATQNKGKQKEIQALLSYLDLELFTPEQLGLNLKIEENGQDYLENAAKKAIAYAEASGMLALADDTGLEVDALGGEPGIFSARYSKKPGATDADRRMYLLGKLLSYPKPWRAQFKCVVAIRDPEGETYHAEGICTGKIIPIERGDHGFGYDSIFQVNGIGYTMAELSLDKKNQISHRARAIHSIKSILFSYLKKSSQ